jgi:hypothetical protein
MPPREPKGRLLSREYFADLEFMTEFSADEREAYILLALFTDDDGYLEWSLGELAGSLYRYDDRADREARLASIVEHLAATGRFEDLGCKHARMPRVATRPRSGQHEYGVRDAHAGCPTSQLETTRDDSTSSSLLSSPIPSVSSGRLGSTRVDSGRRPGRPARGAPIAQGQEADPVEPGRRLSEAIRRNGGKVEYVPIDGEPPAANDSSSNVAELAARRTS